MIKQILKMGGCKTEKEFYKKYPTEESFLEAFPQAQRMIEQYKIGGQSDKSLTPAAFPQAPVADRFFNYGMPAMNIPRPMQEGGQSQQIKNTPILEMIKAIAEYNEMEEADVIQTLQENVPAEQLQMLTDQALSDPETVAKTLNQYIQQLTGSDEQQQMESQYLEGQPLMQDMLAQQAMAQEADQEAMPMDPNMAMQMAYGGSKLRRFIPKHQTKGPVQNQQPPAEEDSFWDSTLGTVSKYGIGVGTGLIGQEIMIRLATSEVVRDALGYTKEKWKNMKVGERLKMIGKSIKKGGLGAGKRYAIGPLVGFALVGIGEALDSPEVESAPSNLKPKSPPAPGASNAFSNPTLVDSSDKDRIPVMMQNAPQSVDSLKAVQQQMIMNKAKKKQSGGIPSSNYGQFTVPMKKGGQSAPMGMSSNDDVTSNRLETLRKFVTDNVYDNMVKEEGEEIMTAYMPQNTMMQEDAEQEYMLYGGRLKKKGRTDERLRMALQGRLDYMQPGGQSDGLTSAFGFVSSPVGSMFDRRTAPTIDGPAPNMSTVGPVQGQGTAINLGGYSNMSQPSGAYNTYAPQSNATTEGIMNMAQNQNKALDQYQTVEGSGKQCPPGYKWDPKRGECVVAQTRAGKALDKMGEWWQNKSGDERANMVLGAANSIVGAKEQMNQRKYEEQLEKQMFNKFTTSVTAPTDKGMHMVNQRTPVPPTMMTPVQFTGQNYTQGYGYAQMGGELYLSDDEIQNIISMGGEVEYLD